MRDLAAGRHGRLSSVLVLATMAAIAVVARTTAAEVPDERSPRQVDGPSAELHPSGAAEDAAPRARTAIGDADPGTALPVIVDGLDPRRYREEDGVLVSDLPGDRTAVLSLDAGLQHEMEDVFSRYEVPHAGLVALEPSTGRVLAYVSHDADGSTAIDRALDASAPAASVFKVITGAALLEAGVSPDERVCYRGGGSSISLSHLDFDAARDTTCATLSEALGRSINPVFARLSDQHLDAATLGRYASAFGFGEALPFDHTTNASRLEVPDDRLERARMSAGFWHTTLSPLHGALIAATIADGGSMPRASIVDEVLDASGRRVHARRAGPFRSVIGRHTAELLNEMMQRTVREGTARRAFHDPHGRSFIPGVEIAGKTGTLSEERPYRGYTWWVGFAPADAPTIALAVLVVNTPEWRIKASDAARFAMEHWLVTRPAAAARAARAEATATSAD